MKVMLDKCADAERMWGCAFAYDVGEPAAAGGRGSSCMFVRLREDRRSVDVVAVMDEGHGSDDVVRLELDSISQLLGKDFNGANERMHLCPMCCSADMFVRCGAVHAFHIQEVAAGIALHCSRYHDVTATDVTRGKLTKLVTDSLPLVHHPSRFHELQLPWQRVTAGDIINNSAAGQHFLVSGEVDVARCWPQPPPPPQARSAPPAPSSSIAQTA
jgi:hypothetical protein